MNYEVTGKVNQDKHKRVDVLVRGNVRLDQVSGRLIVKQVPLGRNAGYDSTIEEQFPIVHVNLTVTYRDHDGRVHTNSIGFYKELKQRMFIGYVSELTPRPLINALHSQGIEKTEFGLAAMRALPAFFEVLREDRYWIEDIIWSKS